jgi:hypothetical protein
MLAAEAEAAAFARTTHRVHAVDVCIIKQSLGRLCLHWSRQPVSAMRIRLGILLSLSGHFDLDQSE